MLRSSRSRSPQRDSDIYPATSKVSSTPQRNCFQRFPILLIVLSLAILRLAFEDVSTVIVSFDDQRNERNSTPNQQFGLGQTIGCLSKLDVSLDCHYRTIQSGLAWNSKNSRQMVEEEKFQKLMEEAETNFTERKVKSMFYLKTHKTGSTSIASSLLEYCRRHGLSTVSAPGNIYIRDRNPSDGRKADALVAHHAVFTLEILSSYLKSSPEVILTSIRLPLQRQLSWFRQQNKQFESEEITASSIECDTKNETLLSYFDEWYEKKGSASQWYTLQETSQRSKTDESVEAILDQFDFVFLKERSRESMECLCAKTGIRLCDREHPMKVRNVKPSNSCVERQLLRYRSEQLIRGAAKDLLLYETVSQRLDECQKNVPLHCTCPEQSV